MSLAYQFRKNSLEANKRKSHKTLTNTLAEKKKTQELLAKQAIEKKENKTILTLLDKFLYEAWKGNFQIILSEKEVKLSHLLTKYGLKLLSTEKFVVKINTKIDEINELFEDAKQLFIETCTLGQVDLNKINIQKISPEFILNESFDFYETFKFMPQKIYDFHINKLSEISRLESKYRKLLSNLSYSQSQIVEYAEELSEVAKPFQKHFNTFQQKYMYEFHRSPNLYRHRRESFQLAKSVFESMGLLLPSLNDINANWNNDSLGNGCVDGLGRYIAFFRIMGGDEPIKAIIENVKEGITFNGLEEISESESEIKKLGEDLDDLKYKNFYLSVSNSLDLKITNINMKISKLRELITFENPSISFNSKYFLTEFIFDLRKIKKVYRGNADLNEIVEEIKLILQTNGDSYVKLIKTIDNASSKGMYSLPLKIIEQDECLVLFHNERKLIKIPISVKSLLKIMKKCGFEYTFKDMNSHSFLRIKW
jgi:hypothetical protein